MDESIVERAALDWLAALGYAVMSGPALGPDGVVAERWDYGQVVLEDRLRGALVRLNPALPTEATEDALRKLTRPEGPTLETRNRAFHRMLVDGVTVEFRREDGSIGGAQARVLDFEDPDNNDWLAVSQFADTENRHVRRPDVVLFVNGLPLALIESKNAAAENAIIWSAFQQLQTYKAELLPLFAFNELLVVSDGMEAMQAIARVNRVFKAKPGGLVVDYLGLAQELKRALATYTESGGTGTTTLNQQEAVAAMLEKYEVCLGLFHGFDRSKWTMGTPAELLGLLPQAQEHILAQEDGKDLLLDAVRDLSQAFALDVPHEEALRIRDDVDFFQAVRAVLAKRTPGRKTRPRRPPDRLRGPRTRGRGGHLRSREPGEAGHLDPALLDNGGK